MTILEKKIDLNKRELIYSVEYFEKSVINYILIT